MMMMMTTTTTTMMMLCAYSQLSILSSAVITRQQAVPVGCKIDNGNAASLGAHWTSVTGPITPA